MQRRVEEEKAEHCREKILSLRNAEIGDMGKGNGLPVQIKRKTAAVAFRAHREKRSSGQGPQRGRHGLAAKWNGEGDNSRNAALLSIVIKGGRRRKAKGQDQKSAEREFCGIPG